MAGENRPAANLTVGMPVVIDDPDPRGRKDQPAHVVKVARAWVTIKHVGGSERRFRIDTQSESTGCGDGGYRFKTLPQAEYDDRINAAWRTIEDHGLTVERKARTLITDEQLFAIANLLAAKEA